MNQKINRINKNWFWYWTVSDGVKLKRFEKLKIEKYFEVLNHLGYTFILHKPETPIPGWNLFMVTEIRTGASAVSGETLEEVKEKWEKWKEKADKKYILICIAKATKKTKILQEKWENDQLQS